MADSPYFNIENLAGQQVPSEIVEQLRVLGRVQFPLKSTTTSAVSSSAQDPSVAQAEAAANLSGVLAHVAEMESLAEQMEDMIDQLTKDMSIPIDPDDTNLRDAVQRLGGDGDNITKDVMDTALAIVDNGPIMLLNQDPVGMMLGNGKLTGPYMNCDEITRGVAKAWNTADPTAVNPDAPINDAANEISKNFEKGKNNMILESLLMLWWNMLWPKFVIMLSIVNPARVIFAMPFDTFVMFFKNMKKECGKIRFQIKPEECIKNYGPINNLINRMACFLLCKIPPKLYKRYKPMVDPSEFKYRSKGKFETCKCDQLSNCPPKVEPKTSFDKNGNFDQMSNLLESIQDPCVTEDDFTEGVDETVPEGLGMPPACLEAAQTVLNAVISDALTPSDPTKRGITGTASVSSILERQTNQLGA